MDTATSYIAVLPSDKKEADEFKKMLKSEVLCSKNPMFIMNQLKINERLFKELLSDNDLNKFLLK
jgi:hypothetical protein